MSRYLFLALGGLSLLAGLDAALLLSALPAPVSSERLPDVHGMLMVLGFLGTLIALERAVALRRPWGYLSPGLLGVGGLALLSPAPLALGRLFLLDGALLLVGVYAALWRRAHDPVVRVGGGNALGEPLLWQVGAAGTVLALLLLPGTAVGIAVTSRRTAPTRDPLPPSRPALRLVDAERSAR